MSEETKKKETIEVLPSTGVDGQEDVDFLYYNVQGLDFSGDKVKVPVAWSIPKTDEEAKERYNVSLETLIGLGVRAGLATAPNYQLEFNGRETDKDGNVTSKGYIDQKVAEACQKLANDYKRGEKGTTTSATKEAKQLNSMRKQSGMTMEETQEAIRQYMASKQMDEPVDKPV